MPIRFLERFFASVVLTGIETGLAPYFSKIKLLPHPNQIQLLNIVSYVLPQVVVPVTGTPKRVSGSLKLYHGDFTSAVALFFAPFADK